jgi:hypothetical protein
MKLPASARSLAFKAYLRYLASTSKPIVIGPFRSELGFEALYWIPLLQWALKAYGISPERCIALSRGGMGVFYPAKHQVDLYTLRGVDGVRVENQIDYETRKLQKQTQVTQWDRKVASEASEAVNASPNFHILHPAWMYWLFEDYWEDRATIQHIARHCDFTPLPVPTLPDGLNLLEKFIAVRFYERHTFPLQDEVKGMAIQMVQTLAKQFPVVLLNQELFADDHADLPIPGDNIFLLPKVKPEQNFVLQAVVLARAQAFVGTYGGVAQWALRYKKPSLSFYTQFNGTALAHRNLSQLLAARMNVPFETVDLRCWRLYESALKQIPEVVNA